MSINKYIKRVEVKQEERCPSVLSSLIAGVTQGDRATSLPLRVDNSETSKLKLNLHFSV